MPDRSTFKSLGKLCCLAGVLAFSATASVAQIIQLSAPISTSISTVNNQTPQATQTVQATQAVQAAPVVAQSVPVVYQPQSRAFHVYASVAAGSFSSVNSAYLVDEEGELEDSYDVIAYAPGYAATTRVGAITQSGLYGGIEIGSQFLEVDRAARYGIEGVSSASLKFTGSVRSTYALAHAGYELRFGQKWAPFVEGGVGYSMNTSDGSYTLFSNLNPLATLTFAKGDETSLMWSGSVGATYAFSENFLIRAGYRYSNFGTAKTGPDSINFALSHEPLVTHGVFVGTEFRF